MIFLGVGLLKKFWREDRGLERDGAPASLLEGNKRGHVGWSVPCYR